MAWFGRGLWIPSTVTHTGRMTLDARMLNDAKPRPNPARNVTSSTGEAQRDVKEGSEGTLDVIQHRGC